MNPQLETRKTKAYGRWCAVLTDGTRTVEGWGINEPAAITLAYRRWLLETQKAPVSGN